LLKGGVAMLTAGALVAGAAAVHPQAPRPSPHGGHGAPAHAGIQIYHRGAATHPSPLANPPGARESAVSGLDSAARGGAGGSSTPVDRAVASVWEGRVGSGVAPAHPPSHPRLPSGGRGSPGREPQTKGRSGTPAGAAPETSADSAIGASPGSARSQGAGASSDTSAPPVGTSSSEPRDAPGSNTGSGSEAGTSASGSPDGGGTHGSDGEPAPGSAGASGPAGSRSSPPETARTAAVGPSGNANAAPNGE
jgi:hypothetical protein